MANIISKSFRDHCLTYANTVQTATTMTMNSPESLTELFHLATASKDKAQSVQIAELMREVGLKCIGLNGVSYAS